jgi:hypothetical protein
MEHVHTYKKSNYTIRTTAKHNVSTAGVGRLTHIGVVGRVVVNAVMDPNRPVVDFLIHCGSESAISYGMTTNNPHDLRAAAEALLSAAALLELAIEKKTGE